MARGLNDTDPEAELVHLELLRRSPPSRRLRLALSLSRTTMSLARGGLARALPGASPQEVGLRFVALHYGAQLAEDVRAYLACPREPASTSAGACFREP